MMEWSIEMSYKNDVNIVSDLWSSGERSMRCPQCKGALTMVLGEPIDDTDGMYTPYRTVIECTSCSFRTTAESFTILGGVRDFDSHWVEIASWSPSGSRVISKFDHILNYDLLKNLKKSGELVEFLILNDHAVQVIG